ncbi:MAG: 2,3-bisphosphoglycerate-independent phosphoglycerate mutase [Candidatus Rokubacteria bacterium]|nr:2,3-bisphosphoglycerate-independent phosphoglycerate mutase [Candidatus Rokubacteria bacterium]MBI2552891.1 2,3-bisphosphoglycerate-independent phosphoglycerate mutase [Candidatus Rokubacteria bacterium]
MDLELIRNLIIPNTTKLVLLSLDGLGGLPHPNTGKSELETARIPTLHALAARSACGLLRHVGPGITPGSGPGHLGLFGYDPLKYQVGRGVLEALGIDFELRAGDVAARGNLCTVDREGRITDRRAGRIATDLCVSLCQRLRAIRFPGVKLFVEPVKEHRFVLILRGAGLSGRLSESDPQSLGVPALPVKALAPAAKRTAALVNRFVAAARKALAGEAPANMILLRGFDQLPRLPSFPKTFGLKAAAIAAYPMYRGLARLVGMEVLKTGATFADEVATLRQHREAYDFFFLHYKDTDKAGEDGDFAGKVAALERLDGFIPQILSLKPDVLAVTGDHASPAVLKGHGWQPVPLLLWSAYCGADPVTEFTERACAAGSLGVLAAQELMPLILANGLRLTKFGA